MKKLLVGLAVVVLLVILAAFVVPPLIPASAYKDRMVAAVKQATGRDLRIDGPIHLALLPEPGVTAQNVGLANLPGAHDPDLVSLKKLEVRIGLLPALHGAIAIRKFILDEPQISLEVDKDGHPNWALGPAAPAAAPATPAPAAAPSPGEPAALAGLQLGDVELQNGRVTYRDDRTGAVTAIEAIGMKLSLPNLASRFAGDGSAVYNGEKVALTIAIDKPGALLAGGQSAVQLSLAADPINLGFKGNVTGLPPAKLGGDVDLEIPSIRGLAKWAGQPIALSGSGLGKLSVKGKLAMDGPTYGFTDATIAVDTMNATGGFSLRTGGARPYMQGTLALDKLDINPYLPPEKPSAAGGAPGAGGAKGAPAAASAAGWSDEPFDVAALHAADADLKLSTGAILYRKIAVGRSALAIHLKDAKLDADLTELALYQGSGHGKVSLDASGAVPALALDFDLAGVAVQPLIEAAADSSRLSGTGKVAIDVAGRGKSQRDLIAALNGKGALDLAKGAISGVNLVDMARNGVASLTGGTKTTDKTEFGALTASYTITNGILKNEDLKLTSGLVPVTGAGTVDLPKRTLDYRVVVAIGGAVPVPIKLSGPWDAPSYAPDLGGALKGVGKSLQNAVPGNPLKNLFGR